MPITWITALLGSLALIGTPLFSGFYSKDSIIEAVHATHIWGSGFANFAVLAGVFVTAFYSFRMYFLVFHGEERFGKAHTHDHSHGHESDAHDEEDHHDDHGHHGLAPGQKPHESPLVVTLPLILLAIPSVIIGYLTIDAMLFGTFFDGVITVDPKHAAMATLKENFHGPLQMVAHGVMTMPFWLALGGVAAAYYCYMVNPRVPAWCYSKFKAVHTLLDNKYYMDKFNDAVFAKGARVLGGGLWNFGDKALIDGLLVNGSAKLVGWFSTVVRLGQTGYIYHYAFVMILGVLATLMYFLPFWHA
jgi:NADH-quinone oxidoreductase subunit L